MKPFQSTRLAYIEDLDADFSKHMGEFANSYIVAVAPGTDKWTPDFIEAFETRLGVTINKVHGLVNVDQYIATRSYPPNGVVLLFNRRPVSLAPGLGWSAMYWWPQRNLMFMLHKNISWGISWGIKELLSFAQAEDIKGNDRATFEP